MKNYLNINLKRARNLKTLLNKKKLLVIFSSIFVYCLIIIGSTYAYLYATKGTNSLSGDLGKARIDLTVERLVPESDMPLVPLLDEVLGNAIQGNGGKSACIDANNNLSC